MKLVLPVLLTTFLGFLIWSLQTNIQRKVEENNKLLNTRLALTEEFYRHKLKAYEDTCAEVAKLRELLERYDEKESEPEIGARTTDSMAAIDRISNTELLYLSDKFKGELSDLWEIGRTRMQATDQDQSALKEQLKKSIDGLRVEMNADLQTKEFRLSSSTSGS